MVGGDPAQMRTERGDGPAAWRWRGLVERRRRQMDAAYAALHRTSEDFWQRRMANRSSVLRRRAADDDLLLQTVLSCAGPDSTVIDVGAGAGRYSLALAPHVGALVAVEPDAAMLPLLQEALEQEGFANVQIVPATWQEAEVAPADLVVCSHVLYPIPDVVPFIHKLDDHASKTCLLALRETVAEPEPLDRLWQHFHGEPRYLQPGYVDAFDLLHEMGIHANVSARRGPGQRWAFADLDQAVAAAREHLILPENSEIDAYLRRELDATLSADEDGLRRLHVDPAYVAVLWWAIESE